MATYRAGVADGPAQHPHVVPVPAGDDDQVAVPVHGQAREDLLVLAGQDFVRLGEAFPVGEALPVVDDRGWRIRPGPPLEPGSSRCARRRR